MGIDPIKQRHYILLRTTEVRIQSDTLKSDQKHGGLRFSTSVKHSPPAHLLTLLVWLVKLN